MKNFLMAFMVMGAFLITSCGGDDEATCQTCTVATIETTYCDLGDGTYTVAVDSIAMDTITGDFSDFITAQELLGTCE